jgi:predicted transcriptional regulator
LTPFAWIPTLKLMEVKLNSELQEKLTRLATERGRDSEALVVEAIERMVNYDEWFLQEVETGIAAADRGELVDHEDVKKLIDQ